MAGLGPEPGSVPPPQTPWYRAGWVKPVGGVVAIALVGFLALQLLGGDGDSDVVADGAPVATDEVATTVPILGADGDGDAAGSDGDDVADDTGATDDAVVLDGSDGDGTGDVGDQGDGSGSDGSGGGDAGGGSSGGGAGGAASTTTTSRPATTVVGATTTTAGGGSGSTTTTTTTTAPSSGSSTTTTTVSAGSTVVVAASRYSADVEAFAFDETDPLPELNVNLYDGGTGIVIVIGGWSTKTAELCLESTWEDNPDPNADVISYSESAPQVCDGTGDYTADFSDCGAWAYAVTSIPQNAVGTFYITIYDEAFDYYGFPEEDFELGSNGDLTPFTAGASKYTLPPGILPGGATAATC